MSLKIFPEVFDRALERFDGAGREGAVRVARAQEPALLRQDINVAGLTLAVFDRPKDLLGPREAVAAGRAPSAGLARKELYQVMHEPHRAGLVVENDHRPRAEPASRLHDRVEVHLHVEMLGDEEIR